MDRYLKHSNCKDEPQRQIHHTIHCKSKRQKMCSNKDKIEPLGQEYFFSVKDENINAKRARKFKDSLANPKRMRDFQSSKLKLYEINVLYGQEFETLPHTRTIKNKLDINVCDKLSIKEKADCDFHALASLDVYGVLEKILEWAGLNHTIQFVREVLNQDKEWNHILESLVNPVCNVLDMLPNLESVDVKEGARFFQHLTVLCQQALHKPIPCDLLRYLLVEFKHYGNQMSAALASRYVSEKPLFKRDKIQDSKHDDGFASVTSNMNQEHEMPYSETDGTIHSILVFIWTLFIKRLASEQNDTTVYQIKGSANTCYKVEYAGIMYRVHCEPDGLLCYDTMEDSMSSDERLVPFLVIQCKTAIRSGWWKQGTDECTVPVAAISGLTRDRSESDVAYPDHISSDTMSQKSKSPAVNSRDVTCPQNTVNSRDVTCPQNTGHNYQMSPQMVIARQLMSSRLDEFRTQHAVELCTALKQAQSKMFRRRTYGLYISDHFVFPTVFEASLKSDSKQELEPDITSSKKDKSSSGMLDDIWQREMDGQLKQKLKHNVISSDSKPSNGTLDKASTEITYKCHRSPLPLNFFSSTHFAALAHYIRFIGTHHMNEVLGLPT